MGSDQFAQFLTERLVNENIKILNDDRNNNSHSSVSVALIDKTGERQTINFGGSGFEYQISKLNFPKKIVEVTRKDLKTRQVIRKEIVAQNFTEANF